VNAKSFLCLIVAIGVKALAAELVTEGQPKLLVHDWEYITFPWAFAADKEKPMFLVGSPGRAEEERSRGLCVRVMNIARGFRFFKTNSIKAWLYRASGEIVQPTAADRRLLNSPVSSSWASRLADGEFAPQVMTYFPWGTNSLEEAWVEISITAERYWLEIPYGFDRNPADLLAGAVKKGPPSFVPFVKWTEHDHRVPWETVHYRLGRTQDGAELSLIQSNPCDAKSDVELYRFPDAQNLYSPRTDLRLLEPDGTMIKGSCVNLHLDDSHLRRTDTFQVVARGGDDSRCWGQLEVTVNGLTNRVVIPSSLYKYTHGHAPSTGTNASFDIDHHSPGGQLDHTEPAW
jgi:hypothetical protein